jgi:hypothetical protein
VVLKQEMERPDQDNHIVELYLLNIKFASVLYDHNIKMR